ncbi:uncharacterized protein LOC128965475 [Oppia nitens]|uniref:uncharacterized protein LOC128965475 n=1 Tax=Oppia nitens TaxID=1686743 RepID=UPI0023D9B00D|nr:uncharacterized protein LOC128965475 [Oppia nitens]
MKSKFDSKLSFVESFAEIPLTELKPMNKSLSTKQLMTSSESSHHFNDAFHPNADINRLKANIENNLSETRNGLSNISLKIITQQWIVNTFNTNNLLTSTQKFTISGHSTQEQEGLNIIGIYPGVYRSGPNDRLLLIGAHYDTVGNTSGVNDNGSGISALLEIIHLLNAYNCRLTYSLMFVALDLEEYGALGSKYFVNDYLIPNELIERKSQFIGAIILDTILNFNQTLGSQDIPYDIFKALPKWSQHIKQTQFVGDFLALIHRNNLDNELSDSITKFWRSHAKQMPYKLSKMSINSLGNNIPDFKTLTNHANLLRSDHIMFWYHNNPLINTTLTAVLLTDTGIIHIT